MNPAGVSPAPRMNENLEEQNSLAGDSRRSRFASRCRPPKRRSATIRLQVHGVATRHGVGRGFLADSPPPPKPPTSPNTLHDRRLGGISKSSACRSTARSPSNRSTPPPDQRQRPRRRYHHRPTRAMTPIWPPLIPPVLHPSRYTPPHHPRVSAFRSRGGRPDHRERVVGSSATFLAADAEMQWNQHRLSGGPSRLLPSDLPEGPRLT